MNQVRYRALELLWRQQAVPREAAQIRSTWDGLSSDDIRASPRLLGSLFAMISSLVLLVSVIQYVCLRLYLSYHCSASFCSHATLSTEFFSRHCREYQQFTQGTRSLGSGRFLHHYEHRVACLSLEIVGCHLRQCHVGWSRHDGDLLHVDTLILPQTWMHVFRDGSLAEGTLMGLLLLGWATGLQ